MASKPALVASGDDWLRTRCYFDQSGFFWLEEVALRKINQIIATVFRKTVQIMRNECLRLRRIIWVFSFGLQILQEKADHVTIVIFRVEKDIIEIDKSEIAPVAYLKIKTIELSDKWPTVLFCIYNVGITTLHLLPLHQRFVGRRSRGEITHARSNQIMK